MVLKSKNLALVEDSVPAFQALCEHEDTTTFQANPALAKQFEDVVRGYATIAQHLPTQAKSSMSAPVTIRWKTAGLQAIKSLTASEGVGSDRGRQLNIVMPVILEHLYSNGENQLKALSRKIDGEREAALKRRTSTPTTRPAEIQIDTKEAVMADTAAESDRIAEEEAGMLAIQSLKQIFTANNRSQIRLATWALLNFLIDKAVPDRPDTAVTSQSVRPGNWTTTIVEIVTKWTPVQDRFIILVTTVENLTRLPIREETMEKQLVLATLVEWLLSSTINMIGLSVMDILLGLIRHILALLRVGDNVPAALPHHEETDAIDLFKPEDEPGNRSSVLDILNNRSFDETRPASMAHQQLLNRLRKCIGSLATHIYYSDQVNDIVSVLLVRLKSAAVDPTAGAAAQAVEKRAGTEATSDASKKDDAAAAADFFSTGTARVTALHSIKDVLIVANRKGSDVGAGIVGRNRIGVSVWEGTQWLLRDPDTRVRRAYAEAILTWLRLEVTSEDFRVARSPKISGRRRTVDFHEGAETSLERSISAVNAAKRPQNKRSSFLQLLHLAIYEDAIEAPETDANILLLHLLNFSIVQRLGVNAIRTGLPMIRRLQEDINASPIINTPKAKINVGSLVHGYFWACCNVFDCEVTAPGYEISKEIKRRKTHGLWLNGVQVPPQNLDMVIASYNKRTSVIPAEKAQTESLRPFDHAKLLIEQIAVAYDQQVLSPPSSPLPTPRRLSVSRITTPGSKAPSVEQLPSEYLEAMDADWTRESCIAAAEKEIAPSNSPTGSRAGTARSVAQANGGTNGGLGPDASAPVYDSATGRLDERGIFVMSAADHLRRGSSARVSQLPTPVNGGSSEHNNTLRVDDLKRALASNAPADLLLGRTRSAARTSSPLRASRTAHRDFASSGSTRTRPSHGLGTLSNASESLIDAEGYISNSDDEEAGATLSRPFSHQLVPQNTRASVPPHASTTDEAIQSPATPSASGSPRLSRGSRPRSGSDVSTDDPEANARALKGQLVPEVVRGSIIAEEGVPPVPPLPHNLMGRSSNNRMRGEALAPGIPYGSPSGRSSSANTQATQPPPSRRSDALHSLPPVTTSAEEAAAAAAIAAGNTNYSRGPPSRGSASSSALGTAGQRSLGPASSARVTAVNNTTATTAADRPESLIAAASANAAGAAAAMEAIAAAGGGSTVPSQATRQADVVLSVSGNKTAARNLAPSDTSPGRAPSYISSLNGDEEDDGQGPGYVSAVASRTGSIKNGVEGRTGGTHKSDHVTRSTSVGKENEFTLRRQNTRALEQALLGSIETVDGGAVSAARGIGRPPV